MRAATHEERPLPFLRLPGEKDRADVVVSQALVMCVYGIR